WVRCLSTLLRYAALVGCLVPLLRHAVWVRCSGALCCSAALFCCPVLLLCSAAFVHRCILRSSRLVRGLIPTGPGGSPADLLWTPVWDWPPTTATAGSAPRFRRSSPA